MNQSPNFDPTNGTPFVDEVFQTPLNPKKSPANGFATASLILGIASLVCTWCCCCLYVLSLLLGAAGIVTAILSARKSDRGMYKKAMAGLILSIIGVVSFVVICICDSVLSNLPQEEILEMLRDFFESMGMDFDEYINEIEAAMTA